MNLRPYQRVTCDAAAKSLEHQHTLVQSPTGTGKTEMAIELSEMAVNRVAGPVVVVAPTDEIFGQMISRYQRAGWMVHADKAERHARPSVAMEQALDGAKVVIVASQQTLAMRDRIERYPRNGWALPILDECLPAGTLVDGRPIETLRVGDVVRSYNHENKRTERRAVTKTFASRPMQLVTVHLADGRAITCTAGHPFFAGSGYRPAAYLQSGDELYGHVGTDAMQGVPHAGGVAQVQGQQGAGASQCGLLLGQLPHGVGVAKLCRDHGSNESAPCQRAHVGAQSDATPGGARQSEPFPSGHRTYAGCARGQRPRADGDGNPPTCCPAHRVDGKLHRANTQGSQCWLSDALQAGPCTTGRTDCCRSGWSQPWRTGETCTGCQEDSVSPVARVDRVEVHERRGADGFGPLCPGDRVYNIEVEHNHNYFVDGLLTHNCHHAPAATWQGIREYFDQPWLGLSATPERAGMRNLWPKQILAFHGGLMEAINEGWLVPFEHHYAAGVTLDDYEALQSDDARDVDCAIERSIATLLDLLKAGPGLAFWPRVRAAKQAAKFLRSMTPEISARALAGKGMPRDERRLALRQYAAGTLRMLSLCNVGVEGLDVPGAAAGLIMQMTKVRSRVAQMMGRFLRPLAECLRGLDEAPAEVRRAAIAASAKPLARIASIAPPDVIDGWETPGMLLWGHLPEPVLIDIDRRQREGRDLETAKREAIEAEADREARRKAAREKHDRDLAAAAPARAAAVDRAQPYELRDHADAAHAARRARLTDAWRRWAAQGDAGMVSSTGGPDLLAVSATPKQAMAIARLVAEFLRQPVPRDDHGRVGAQVLTWDSKTASKAQQALRHMCGHTSPGYQKQRG